MAQRKRQSEFSSQEKEIVDEIHYRIHKKSYGHDAMNDPRRIALLTRLKKQSRSEKGTDNVEESRRNTIKFISEKAKELEPKNAAYYDGTDVPVCLCPDEAFNPLNKMQKHMVLVLSQGLKVKKNRNAKK